MGMSSPKRVISVPEADAVLRDLQAVVTPKLSSTGQPQFGSEICTCDNCPDATNSAAPEKRCGITCGACV